MRSSSLEISETSCSDYEALGTLALKMGCDERYTSGMECCSVLNRWFFACSRLRFYELWYLWCHIVSYIVFNL